MQSAQMAGEGWREELALRDADSLMKLGYRVAPWTNGSGLERLHRADEGW